MMATDHHRPSSKLTRAPLPPTEHSTLNTLQSGIPINPSLPNLTRNQTHIVKDLRKVNLLDELYLFENNKIHVQETVEIIPQPVSCERIFYSYIDDHTNIRSREYIKLDQGLYMRSNDSEQIYTDDDIVKLFDNIEYDQRLKLDFYSTTLYIFPKQRNEKFISEIRYIPEHITIRYKTTLELLAATLTSLSHEHYYQNIHDFYDIAKDIFYRI
jgi:hypothetical protein